jgi:hypothetical protein
MRLCARNYSPDHESFRQECQQTGLFSVQEVTLICVDKKRIVIIQLYLKIIFERDNGKRGQSAFLPTRDDQGGAHYFVDKPLFVLYDP